MTSRSFEKWILKLEAQTAQTHGFDTSLPGWREKYMAYMRERDAELDGMIATPHTEEAIAAKEEQFEGVSRLSTLT